MREEKYLDKKIIASNQRIKERNFWLNKLSGNPVKVVFPYDYNETRIKEGSLTGVEFKLPDELYLKLIEISKGSNYALHIILVAGIVILLDKCTDSQDIIVGTPAYSQNIEANFINTTLILRNFLHDNTITFKEFLMQVKQTVAEAVENQNYPIEVLLQQLGISFNEGDFPLFDVAILLTNIHDKKYIQHIKNNITFSFIRTGHSIEGVVTYNSCRYIKSTVERLIFHLKHLLSAAIFNLEIQLKDIDMLSAQEKQRLLYQFNDPKIENPIEKTIHKLFEEQVAKTPLNIAVRYKIDSDDQHFLNLNTKNLNKGLLERYGNCCFRKNPYLFYFKDQAFLGLKHFIYAEDVKKSVLLKTNHNEYIIVEERLALLLESFNGKTNVKSIFRAIEKKKLDLFIYELIRGNDLGTFSFKKREFSINNFDDFVSIINSLFVSGFLALVDYNKKDLKVNICLEEGEAKLHKQQNTPVFGEKLVESNLLQGKKNIKSPVLLVGDTTEIATTGLLYLASFLRRNGIEAYCQWNDLNDNVAALRQNIKEILAKIRPKVVGVSMKWFPHIARTLEKCRIVKEYDPSIVVVVGGNTASYYPGEIVQYEWIDYVVRGDGEVPLLDICSGGDFLPNCTFKQNGRIVCNPITYVQDETDSKAIYLSQLDKIFVSAADARLPISDFYINTGKGCSQNCFYCAGSQDVQEKSFNRTKPFLRGVNEIRKDIVAAGEYAATFMFDFDLPLYNSHKFYKDIWEGIDLSTYFCGFYFWKLPREDLIALISKTFKYAYLNIDLCSLSEKHRMKLTSLGVVKPQPTDEELFSFFDMCSDYKNVEVKINLVAGLPFFTSKDIKISEETLKKIISRYPFFGGIDWGRLHAQPGASLTNNCNKYNMYSLAGSFDDFFSYSKQNLEEKKYPGLSSLHYPYIYYNDDRLNSEISRHYFKVNQVIEKNEERKKMNFFISENITYSELNKSVNRLAKILIQRGLQPGSIVGIISERSIEMIVGILGILKAGGAYLPIEPNSPKNRIKYILEDSNTKIILTQKYSQNLIQDMKDEYEIVDLESIEDIKVNGEDLEKLNIDFNLAYVIYTSGSTGKPKGVLGEHRSTVNTLLHRKEEYNMNADVISLQLFSYAFDGFITGFFTPLISGGENIIISENTLKDIEYLRKVIENYKITHFICVPSLFQAIIGDVDTELDTVKLVTLAGDKLSPNLPQAGRRINRNIEVSHEYGVTEAAIMSTIYRHQERNKVITIGKPVLNTKTFIINKNRRLQPIGIPGELCISGSGLSRGYLNNPQLTDEKFLLSPVVDRKKIYRTGDLARWLPDGNIEFLGRIDLQVKIRGFRIEPGEIENQVLMFAGIKDAVVMTRRDRNGEKYLCAYYISEEVNTESYRKQYENSFADKEYDVVDTRNLKEFLSQYLPDYMIPLRFVRLASMPLTANGKIDRRSLPEPGSGGKGEEYVPPRDKLEEKLTEIWSEVLGVKKEMIGINSNFFNLGGHSLNATKLVSKIHKEFDVKIPVTEIFKSPTITGISIFIKEANKDEFYSIKSFEKKEYYALSSAQKRLYILQQMDAESTAYNMPQVIPLNMDIDKKILDQTFKKLIKRHESLRTSFVMINEEPQQIINTKTEFRVGYLDSKEMSAAGRKEINEVFLREVLYRFEQPFELCKAPLLRAVLIKIKGVTHILIVDMHHIISDAVSRGLLERDFMALYKEEELPGLRLQYKDYVEWQNKILAVDGFKKQEEYWLKIFKGEIPELNLPTDFPRPPVKDYEGGSFQFAISNETKNRLEKIARGNNCTLFMILLTIYYILLSRYSGQEDIIVGTPIEGRPHIDLNNIVGFFVNTLALRNFPSYNKTFVGFMEEVIESSTKAFENQDYPFDLLVEKLGLMRNVSRHPLFDTVFALDKHEIQSTKVPALDEIESSPTSDTTTFNTTSKFDLRLGAFEMVDRISFEFEYRSTLFKKRTIRTMSRHFMNIIEEVTQDPDIKISEIGMLSIEEKSQIRNEMREMKEKSTLTQHTKNHKDGKKKIKIEINF